MGIDIYILHGYPLLKPQEEVRVLLVAGCGFLVLYSQRFDRHSFLFDWCIFDFGSRLRLFALGDSCGSNLGDFHHFHHFHHRVIVF